MVSDAYNEYWDALKKLSTLGDEDSSKWNIKKWEDAYKTAIDQAKKLNPEMVPDANDFIKKTAAENLSKYSKKLAEDKQKNTLLDYLKKAQNAEKADYTDKIKEKFEKALKRKNRKYGALGPLSFLFGGIPLYLTYRLGRYALGKLNLGVKDKLKQKRKNYISNDPMLKRFADTINMPIDEYGKPKLLLLPYKKAKIQKAKQERLKGYSKKPQKTHPPVNVGDFMKKIQKIPKTSYRVPASA